MQFAKQALLAFDIGNSRLKIGRFESTTKAANSLPEPALAASFSIDHVSGTFDAESLVEWCVSNAEGTSNWVAASVHRGAADQLKAAMDRRAVRIATPCTLRWLTYRDVALPIEVDEPARVGIDRLLAAVAADRLRERGRPAAVVDLGTAITVDLLTAEGAFAGGAILPGIAMSARALAEQTDALPRLPIDALEAPPAAVGKSTSKAIEAGLYWGAVGAIRELVARLSAGCAMPPEVFLTGGASPHVAELLQGDWPVRHVPHLVLSGIALVADVGS